MVEKVDLEASSGGLNPPIRTSGAFFFYFSTFLPWGKMVEKVDLGPPAKAQIIGHLDI